MKYLDRLHHPDCGLFFLRLALGIVFVVHGWLKVQDLAGTVGFIGSLGVPGFLGYVVAAVELLGGLALILGLWVNVAALLLAITMLFAIYLVTFSKGFFGYEFNLVLILASLAVLMLGPGNWTVMKWFGKK